MEYAREGYLLLSGRLLKCVFLPGGEGAPRGPVGAHRPFLLTLLENCDEALSLSHIDVRVSFLLLVPAFPPPPFPFPVAHPSSMECLT